MGLSLCTLPATTTLASMFHLENLYTVKVAFAEEAISAVVN